MISSLDTFKDSFGDIFDCVAHSMVLLMQWSCTLDAFLSPIYACTHPHVYTLTPSQSGERKSVADRKRLAATYAKAISNLYPPHEPAQGAPSPATEGASAQRIAMSIHMNAEELVSSAIAMSVPSPMRNRAPPSVVVVSVFSRVPAPPVHTHVENDEPNKHDLGQEHNRSREQEQAPKSSALCEAQRQPQEKEKGACGVVQTEVAKMVPASLPSPTPYTNEERGINDDFEKGVGKMETRHKKEGKEHREQMEAKERKGTRNSRPCPIDVQFTVGECVAGKVCKDVKKVCKEAGVNLERKTQQERHDESGSEAQQDSAGKLHQKAESPQHDAQQQSESPQHTAQQQSESSQQHVQPETESVQHKTQQQAVAGVVEAVVVEAVDVEARTRKSRLCPINLKHSPSELLQQAQQQAAQPAAQQKEAARVAGALDLLSTDALPVPTEPLCLQVLVVNRMRISSLDCSHLRACSRALWLVHAHPTFRSLAHVLALVRSLAGFLARALPLARSLFLFLSHSLSRARALSLSLALSLLLFLSFSLALSFSLLLSLSFSPPFSLPLPPLSHPPFPAPLPLAFCVCCIHTLSRTHTHIRWEWKRHTAVSGVQSNQHACTHTFESPRLYAYIHMMDARYCDW